MTRVSKALVYLGVVAVVLGLSKVHAAFIADTPYDFTGSSRFGWAIGYMAVLGFAAYGFGLPELPRTRRDRHLAAIWAAVVAALAVSVAQLAVGDALLPRFVVLGSALVLIDWFSLCSWFATRDRSAAEGKERVVVVAAAGDASSLEEDLGLVPERPAQIVGTMTFLEARSQSPLGQPLVALAKTTAATIVVLDVQAQAEPSVVSQAALLHQDGVRVRTLSLFYEQWLGKLPAAELERVSLLFDIGELHRARYGRLKRVMDLCLALVMTVPLLVVTPLVWLGDRIANRGPLFYRQERVGKRGRRFEILKYRTMTPGEGDSSHNEWTTEDDPRITPFGRFLRRTHLDELPQVLNLLRGDLSVVGPRPEQPGYVEELIHKLPFYDVRHLVRPGITGWAQVKYGYAGDETDALEKLQYDFYYLRHQGLSFDARIMGRTVRHVLGGGGR
ncbi:MAG: hypothetical protein JJLCMIEE_02606 [Acidimicrobiales bacterium]|nr:MAG: hypothetical protein EDR02_09505 [Actinomycetota bacterium]MBV6509513.1 hypothetical protein [Acidimicrobiales bacterium]RIK06616.1 MAG: hypothetical protein DCC48_06830 [Acidobacteriota bacterium]